MDQAQSSIEAPAELSPEDKAMVDAFGLLGAMRDGKALSPEERIRMYRVAERHRGFREALRRYEEPPRPDPRTLLEANRDALDRLYRIRVKGRLRNLTTASRPTEGAGKATGRFTPTEADRNILQALAKAKTTTGQVVLEQASGEPIRTVKDRLPVLEDARLVDRPHGPKCGYAITRRGLAMVERTKRAPKAP